MQERLIDCCRKVVRLGNIDRGAPNQPQAGAHEHNSLNDRNRNDDAAVRYEGEMLPMPSMVSGWLSSYLAISGLVRAIGSQFDDPHGDFLLTLADEGARRMTAATTRRGEIANRHLLEGPEVRDRVVRGSQVGLAAADVVIITSRIKEDWLPGTVVLSNRGEFRIGELEDRTIDGRLRRVYALARISDLEAFRRTVTYEFPEYVAPDIVVPREATR